MGTLFWSFQSVARSGQESIAQGLPWVNSPTGVSPEGADRCGGSRLRTFEQDRVCISSPFRAKHVFRITQGKPWAKLSCPFGAGPSGCMTDAKHTRNPGLSFPAPSGRLFDVKHTRDPGDGSLNGDSRSFGIHCRGKLTVLRTRVLQARAFHPQELGARREL
jgi:hypothetical protein